MLDDDDESQVSVSMYDTILEVEAHLFCANHISRLIKKDSFKSIATRHEPQIAYTWG